MDNVSSAMGARAGIVVISPEGVKVQHSFRLSFRASNNKAKHEALLPRLRVAFSLGVANLEVYLDSRLVVSQVEGSSKAKDSRMVEYLKLVKQMMSNFQKNEVSSNLPRVEQACRLLSNFGIINSQ